MSAITWADAEVRFPEAAAAWDCDCGPEWIAGFEESHRVVLVGNTLAVGWGTAEPFGWAFWLGNEGAEGGVWMLISSGRESYNYWAHFQAYEASEIAPNQPEEFGVRTAKRQEQLGQLLQQGLWVP